MRVAFVSNVVYPFTKGGAEKRIHEIGRRLAADGHEVTVYARHFWDGPDAMQHHGMTLRSVAPATDLYAGDRRSIVEALDFSARLLPPLRSALSEQEHDVIVASVFPYFPVISSELASLGEDTPLVTTWHEVWRSYWDEYLGPLSPFGKVVERITAKTPQKPIAISDVTASRLADIGPSRSDIEVVPNGIDIDKIQRISPAEDGYDVLFAGRLIEHKNVDVLLDAFDDVAADHDASLGIIGDGPEANSLRRHARSLDRADRIDFLGFLEDYDDVLRHMHAADVFASPSTREGFGITYLEAMATDCTVIAVDHPDSAAAEVIGDAGFLAAPTTAELAATLDRALAGERAPASPTATARQYDWNEIATRAERAYERAASNEW